MNDDQFREMVRDEFEAIRKDRREAVEKTVVVFLDDLVAGLSFAIAMMILAFVCCHVVA